MIVMTVLYRAPEDPEMFEKRYIEGHLPIVRQYANMKDSGFAKVTRVLMGEFPYAYVFRGEWADKEGWKADLSSEKAKQAAADAQEFATQGFDVVVLERLA